MKEREQTYQSLLEGLNIVLINYALGNDTDLTREGAEELEFIMYRTGPTEQMIDFYQHLIDNIDSYGWRGTHETKSEFVEIFPKTAKLLTIFVYS